MKFKWCPGLDLNQHAAKHTPLKRACLPINKIEIDEYLSILLFYHIQIVEIIILEYNRINDYE